MASEVEICNRALQKIGAKRISSLSEDTVNARACNACYATLRDAELRAHVWNFAIARAELAADATDPDWGRAKSYTLPADFLRLINDYPEDNSLTKDWQIEGNKILTDDSDPIYIRYIARITDAALMDVLFREVLSARIAMEICEEITQSNTKFAAISEDYKAKIKEARRTNAIENVAAESPEDEWIYKRA